MRSGYLALAVRPTALLLMMLPMAGTETRAEGFADAVLRGEYTVASGDVNGDGISDLRLYAPPRIVVGPDDQPAPVVVPSTGPTFVLLSQGSDSYTVNAEPAPAILHHAAWTANTHELIYGGGLGGPAGGVLARARQPGRSSFVIAGPAAGQAPRLVQVLLPGTLGLDLGGEDVRIELEDRNDDARADLLVRFQSSPPRIFLAGADGRFRISEEGDIQAVWLGLTDAWSAGDLQRALTYVHEDAAPRYARAFGELGAELAVLPAAIAAPQAVSITPHYAEFVTTVSYRGDSALHFLLFTRQQGRWVLASF